LDGSSRHDFHRVRRQVLTELNDLEKSCKSFIIMGILKKIVKGVSPTTANRFHCEPCIVRGNLDTMTAGLFSTAMTLVSNPAT
jgi:hypothetical protein